MESQVQTEKPKTKKYFPNRCMGIIEEGKFCDEMLSSGTYYCPKCLSAKKRKRLGGIRISGPKVNRRGGNPPSDPCD